MLPLNMRDLTVTMREAMHFPCSPLCSTYTGLEEMQGDGKP